MKKYHLNDDFGVYKSTIARNFYSNDRPLSEKPVEDLLNKRTRTYSLAELRLLFAYLWTSHDETVDNNPHEYSPLQVHVAREKIRFGQECLRSLTRMEEKTCQISEKANE